MSFRTILPVFALSIILAACSSEDGGGDTSTGGGAGSSTNSGVGGQFGGAPAVGGGGVGGLASAAGAGGQGSTGTSPNLGCPEWPHAQLWPLIGPFFYGPNPGPCSYSEDGETFSYAYDASNAPTRLASADGSYVETYTYDQGLLVTITETLTATDNATLTYHYGTNSTGYAMTNGTLSLGQGEYTLDSLGYPLSGTWTSTSGVVNYGYEYEACLLKRRVKRAADGTVDESGTVQYSYDSEQRLISATSAGSTRTFDYSCW